MAMWTSPLVLLHIALAALYGAKSAGLLVVVNFQNLGETLAKTHFNRCLDSPSTQKKGIKRETYVI